MKVIKANPIETAQKLGEAMRRGPNDRRLKTWDDLVHHLKKLKVTPEEAYKKITSDNARFNWKMMRLTMYVWERISEDKNGYLKPKIDTVRAVVDTKRFRDFFKGYYPYMEFEPDREVKLLNKLITEQNGYNYLIEGNYLYPGTNKVIPAKYLDDILWPKK